MTSTDFSTLYTLEQTALYLRISKPTLYRLLRANKLCGVKVGGQWRISSEAIRSYLEDKIQLK